MYDYTLWYDYTLYEQKYMDTWPWHPHVSYSYIPIAKACGVESSFAALTTSTHLGRLSNRFWTISAQEY